MDGHCLKRDFETLKNHKEGTIIWIVKFSFTIGSITCKVWMFKIWCTIPVYELLAFNSYLREGEGEGEGEQCKTFSLFHFMEREARIICCVHQLLGGGVSLESPRLWRRSASCRIHSLPAVCQSSGSYK